jgi:hypothetical protein
MRNGSPVFKLRDVQEAIAARAIRRTTSLAARERLLSLQAEKLTVQIAVMRKELVNVADVQRWGVELGGAVRKIVSKLHLEAAGLAGLDTPAIERRLKEFESEILTQFQRLDEVIEGAVEESSQIEAARA